VSAKLASPFVDLAYLREWAGRMHLRGMATAAGADLWTSDAEGFAGVKATVTFA
jgi:hypothetical protein